MKKNNLPLLMLAVPLLAGLLAFRPINKVSPVEAYDQSELTKDINLNDCSEEIIRSYYANLDSKDESRRKGQNLLAELKPILSNGQQYFSYDDGDGKDIFKMYEITDRDWSKSPASEIPGYNASTNTITNYSYGSSTSKKGSNPYLHALYIDRNVENKMHAWATDSGETSHGKSAEWHIDREHIWPKSFGFEYNEEKDTSDPPSSGARGDPMHLWAGDSYVNSVLHKNYFYGIVDKKQDYVDGKDTFACISGNYRGKSKTLGGSTLVFEPQDSDKGDIARACFYMVARYNNIAGGDTIENDNPNLELVNDLSAWVSSGYISTSTTTGKLGILKDLLQWNIDDPVSPYELHRNNLLYRNFTKNRNPFIDFPQWADIIWGENTEGKAATPATDKIAEPKDYVPQISNDDGLIFGLPKTYVYIGAGVLGVIVLIVVIVIATKGSKKQKKALKKIGKKVVKSQTKGKKRK